MSPRTIEVLINAYDRLKITEAWIEAVSPELLQVRHDDGKCIYKFISVCVIKRSRTLTHTQKNKVEVIY